MSPISKLYSNAKKLMWPVSILCNWNGKWEWCVLQRGRCM